MEEWSINDIITSMRTLALEIGGDHHSNKESEQLLTDLANKLNTINEDLILHAQFRYNNIKRLTGYNESDIFLVRKQRRNNAQ